MRHYEIVFLVHPDQSEQVKGIVAKYAEIIKADGGIIHRQEDWGRKQLAYAIQRVHKAHFILFNVECNDRALIELKDAFKFSNGAVLRHLVIRRDKPITEPSPLAKRENTTRQSGRGSDRDAA